MSLRQMTDTAENALRNYLQQIELNSELLDVIRRHDWPGLLSCRQSQLQLSAKPLELLQGDASLVESARHFNQADRGIYRVR